ncbi:hypothetical protein PEX2_082290 [Penicillium expansum]|uniref:Uncharacterized protein n=1 Tax=Penicillium expansum TaxID=27334 RepID=A0A0A2I1J4_PENEN|nr:hypothetical protein PEX2_082290 [Penicillium expansum]KGO36373.1 hypothetical protein PEXP_103330 [Penicillium expansum]KGO52582.1 hypothetical protein PEX2_082290 [Penicillium expansum]
MASPAGIYEYENNSRDDQAVFAALASDYDDSTPTTTTSISSPNPDYPNESMILSTRFTREYYADNQDSTTENVSTNSYRVTGPIDAGASGEYPASLGTFDLPAQYTDCKYSGNTDSVGSVTCGSKSLLVERVP